MPGLIERTIGRAVIPAKIRFDRSPLQNLPENTGEEVVRIAEDLLSGGFPYLPLSLYRDYSRTGNRKNYETPYFHKRRLLSSLVVAEAVENRERFLPDIEEGIWSLLSEPAWTMPAHNTYIRDAEELDTPLTERPVLDLFQCETGEILALTVSLLEDRLNPVLVRDVLHALEERIIIPYTTDHFWWMGGMEPLNNWTPWCTQNVLLTASVMTLEEKTRSRILREAVISLDQYIDSYPEDGCCDEGASYYHAAALALWGCLYVIRKWTGADLDPVFRDPKVKAMAGYIENVHIKDDLYLNYADCSPNAGHLTAREYLFGKATGNTALMHHAALDALSDWKESDNDYNLFYKYIALSSYEEIRKESETERKEERKPFTAFRNAGLAVYREKDVIFSVKGGNNGESHNHNDCGSIILYKDGKPCLIDIGVGTYTKTTFSKDRYTLFPMRSTYHNVLNFPPLEQHDGAEFAARTILMEENRAFFDLTAAYEKGKGLRKYIRTVEFDRDSMKIEIREDFDSDNPAVLTLMSVERPVREGRSIRWKTFNVDFTTQTEISVEEIPITDQRLLSAWPERIYRTLVTIPCPSVWTISFTGGNDEN